MLPNELVKKIRKDKNMTTRQFADKVGLTNSYISQIERNKSGRGKEIRLPIDTLKQICTGINYPFRQFLEEAGYIEAVPLSEPSPKGYNRLTKADKEKVEGYVMQLLSDYGDHTGGEITIVKIDDDHLA